MSRPKRALIAGAGIAGLSAAMALRRSGIESQLVEIRSALGEIGAGLHIPGNGVRALYQLGIGDEARDGGQTFTLRIRLDAGGRLQYEEEVGAVWGRKAFTLAYTARFFMSCCCVRQTCGFGWELKWRRSNRTRAALVSDLATARKTSLTSLLAPTACIPKSARSRFQRRRLPTAATCIGGESCAVSVAWTTCLYSLATIAW